MDTLADLIRAHRIWIMLVLFAGICWWAFRPAIRRRLRARRRRGE